MGSMTARFITHRERNLIGSLMLKKQINDKHISRKFGQFHKITDFRKIMKGQKVVEENNIADLINYLEKVNG